MGWSEAEAVYAIQSIREDADHPFGGGIAGECKADAFGAEYLSQYFLQVVSAVSAMILWRWSHRFSQRLYHVLSLQAPGNPGVFCCPAYMCWQNESALVLSAMIWVLVALLNGLQYRAAPRHFPFSRARKTKSRSPTQRFIILTPQARLTSA